MSRELWTLVLVLVFAGAVWGFIELADAVLEGETRQIDEALLLALRDPADASQPLGPPWLRELMRDVSALGSTGVLILFSLAVTGFLVLQRKRRAAVFLVLAVAGGAILSFSLKLGFGRPRPELLAPLTYTYTASFPSGHAMLATVTYLTLGALLARIQPQPKVKVYLLATALLFGFLVGFSRIYLGVHWPSDVVAGWAAGAAWALLCWLLARWMQRHRYIEEER